MIVLKIGDAKTCECKERCGNKISWKTLNLTQLFNPSALFISSKCPNGVPEGRVVEECGPDYKVYVPRTYAVFVPIPWRGCLFIMFVGTLIGTTIILLVTN